MTDIPDPTLLRGLALEQDDYVPKSAIFSSELSKCPRAMVYRWNGTPKRETDERSVVLKEVMFELGHDCEDAFAKALERGGYLIEREVALSDVMPEGMGGRADFLVDYGDGRRFVEYKSTHPQVHFDSLPYMTHALQGYSYWHYGAKKHKVTQPTQIVYEPIGGRGGPFQSFELHPSDWLTGQLLYYVGVALHTREMWEADNTWIPDPLPPEVQQKGKKLLYKAPYLCSTKWCDYCADGQGNGVCMYDPTDLVLQQERTKKGEAYTEDCMDLTPYRDRIRAFYEYETQRQIHKDRWINREFAPLPDLPVVQR